MRREQQVVKNVLLYCILRVWLATYVMVYTKGLERPERSLSADSLASVDNTTLLLK